MSALLSKLNLSNLTICTPSEALALIAFRGEWSTLAARIVSALDGSAPGSMVKLSTIGLAASDFKRTTATDTKAIGDVDYSGLSTALRTHGFKLVPLVDESDRGVMLPSDREAIAAKVAASKAKAAAKQKAKAAAAKAAKSKSK